MNRLGLGQEGHGPAWEGETPEEKAFFANETPEERAARETQEVWDRDYRSKSEPAPVKSEPIRAAAPVTETDDVAAMDMEEVQEADEEETIRMSKEESERVRAMAWKRAQDAGIPSPTPENVSRMKSPYSAPAPAPETVHDTPQEKAWFEKGDRGPSVFERASFWVRSWFAKPAPDVVDEDAYKKLLEHEEESEPKKKAG